MTGRANPRSLAGAMSACFLIALGLAAALAYAPLTARQPSVFRSLVKTLPLAAFTAGAATGGAPWPVVLGLGLSALGDLALSRPGARAFLAGLSAFAAAHLAYLAAFLPLAAPPGPGGLAGAALLVALAASTERWLAPHTGPMRAPVRLYVVLITAMALAALAAARVVPLATAGALGFLASDVILAVVLFRLAEDDRRAVALGRILWALYVGGQALILAGFLPA